MEVWGTYQDYHKTFGTFENDELVGWVYEVSIHGFALPGSVFCNSDGHPVMFFHTNKDLIDWISDKFCRSIDYLPARAKMAQESQDDSPKTAQDKHTD